MKKILLILLISMHVHAASHNSFEDKGFILEQLDALREALLWTRAIDEVPNLDTIIASVKEGWSFNVSLLLLQAMIARIIPRLDFSYSTDRNLAIFFNSFGTQTATNNLFAD